MFDPADFLRLAEEMSAGDEARLRTAVSRAYYAVFLLARQRFGVGDPTPEAHREVFRVLYRRRGPAVAARMRSLRRLRNASDYDLRATVGTPEVARALELAGTVRGAVEGRGLDVR